MDKNMKQNLAIWLSNNLNLNPDEISATLNEIDGLENGRIADEFRDFDSISDEEKNKCDVKHIQYDRKNGYVGIPTTNETTIYHLDCPSCGLDLTGKGKGIDDNKVKCPRCGWKGKWSETNIGNPEGE